MFILHFAFDFCPSVHLHLPSLLSFQSVLSSPNSSSDHESCTDHPFNACYLFSSAHLLIFAVCLLFSPCLSRAQALSAAYDDNDLPIGQAAYKALNAVISCSDSKHAPARKAIDRTQHEQSEEHSGGICPPNNSIDPVIESSGDFVKQCEDLVDGKCGDTVYANMIEALCCGLLFCVNRIRHACFVRNAVRTGVLA